MADYSTDSMYRNTDMVDGKYLDIYKSSIGDPSTIEVTTLTLEPKYNQRPDVLAHDLFGNAKLWWVFAELNQDILVDPIIDFKSGITINIPVRFS